MTEIELPQTINFDIRKIILKYVIANFNDIGPSSCEFNPELLIWLKEWLQLKDSDFTNNYILQWAVYLNNTESAKWVLNEIDWPWITLRNMVHDIGSNTLSKDRIVLLILLKKRSKDKYVPDGFSQSELVEFCGLEYGTKRRSIFINTLKIAGLDSLKIMMKEFSISVSEVRSVFEFALENKDLETVRYFRETYSPDIFTRYYW